MKDESVGEPRAAPIKCTGESITATVT